MAKNTKVHPSKSVTTNESIVSSKAFGLTPFKYLPDEHAQRHVIIKEEIPPKPPTPTFTKTSNGSGQPGKLPPQQPTSSNAFSNNDTGQSGQQPLPSTSAERPNKGGQSRDQNEDQDKDNLSGGSTGSSIPNWHPLVIRSNKILLDATTSQPFDTKDNRSGSADDQLEDLGAALPDELLPLEETTMLFVVKQLKPMKFQNSVPMLQCFKIFNQRGEHILSAGEVKISRCVKFSKYEFLCFVFTKEGSPFMTIAQRNESFHAFTKSQRKDWLIHQQADDWLNRKYRLVIGDDVDDRRSHVHASLVTGAFLGHIWGGGDQFIIHDIEYNPNISIIRRELTQMETVVLPKNERRMSAFNESLATSCDVKYELYVETAQVGEICANVKFEENNDFGSNKPEHCVGAIYPLHFEAEEKALLLAFLLYYNRTDGMCRNICDMLMSGYCISCYVFVVVAAIVIILSWHFSLSASGSDH